MKASAAIAIISVCISEQNYGETTQVENQTSREVSVISCMPTKITRNILKSLFFHVVSPLLRSSRDHTCGTVGLIILIFVEFRVRI